MLLAIIMDTYAVVKSQLGEANSVWAEGYNVARRWYQKRQGERVSPWAYFSKQSCDAF